MICSVVAVLKAMYSEPKVAVSMVDWSFEYVLMTVLLSMWMIPVMECPLMHEIMIKIGIKITLSSLPPFPSKTGISFGISSFVPAMVACVGPVINLLRYITVIWLFHANLDDSMSHLG